MGQRQRSYTEQESLAALAATEIGPRTARCMSWLFVAIVLTVPLLQAGVEISRRQLPQPLTLLRPLPAALSHAAAGRLGQAWQELDPLLSADALHAFEEDLQRQSLFRQSIQPWVQAGLVAAGGFGNSDCVIGRHGWLFYQPGLDYLTGPDLLDPAQLQARARKRADSAAGTPAHPDPRPAILQLHQDCRQAGVRLILVPVPDKGMIQSGHLTRRLKRDGPLPMPNNTGYERLVEELRSKGVEVFDPAPESVLPWEERYLVHDTHWTPDFMQETAIHLACFVHAAGPLPALRNPMALRAFEKQISRVGDLVSMLRLPRQQSLFPAQTITIHPLVDYCTHRYWSPDPSGDVLLLGDSFTNIYSDGEGDTGLGWGHSAGFGAYLSCFLCGRPVDVIARNGAGATQVRAELARRPQPLQGKRLVIWQFAARELAVGDWKPVPLRTSISSPSAQRASEPAGERLVVEATILAASRTPSAASAPYKDCLTFMKVRLDRVVHGSCPHEQVIAAFWGLKDSQPQPAAHYRPGDRFRLTLVPLAQAANELQSVRFADDLNDYEHATYFVEECSR